MTAPKKSSEQGNALWFILIAIVLLGALTVLLTRSGGNVSQSGDVEQSRIKVSSLMRYAKGLETAIDQMKIAGVSENQISFKNSLTATDYTNANCTTPDCEVFSSAGGGQTYRIPANMNDGSHWIFTGANNVGTTAGPIGTTAAGTGNDLIMLLPGIPAELCVQINRDLDVGTPGTIPQDAAITTTAFTGSYAASLTILEGDAALVQLNNKTAGCFTDLTPNPDINYFYFVLLAR
jgi:hypothetical protein